VRGHPDGRGHSVSIAPKGDQANVTFTGKFFE